MTDMPMKDRPTEQLRTALKDALNDAVTNLLAATRATHQTSMQLDLIKLKWIQGLGDPIETALKEIKAADQQFAQVYELLEILSERAKEER